jgi:hypothetical protein
MCGALVLLVGCASPPTNRAVSAVAIDQGDTTARVSDGATTFTATVDAVGGAPTGVTWGSSAPQVAAIGPGTGVATLIAPGTTTITASSTFDATVGDSVTLTLLGSTYVLSGGDSGSGGGEGVAAMPDGGALVVGTYAGSATYGTTELLSAGEVDVVVARVGRDGTWQWARSLGGPGLDYGYAIDRTAGGGALVAGSFRETASFDAFELESLGNGDAFVAKLDASGTVVWAARAGGTGEDLARSVRPLTDGGALVAGSFSTTATFGSLERTSEGATDVFVAKLDADGSWAWASQAGSTGSDSPRDLAVLPDGGAIVVGSFSGTATFGTYAVTASAGVDLFVARIGADGTWLWARSAGGAGRDVALGVSALPGGGAVVSGSYGGTFATFGASTLPNVGDQDAFVATIDGDGTWLWARRAGGTLFDEGAAIVALDDGSALVAGTFMGAATFDATTITAAAREDIFVAKIGANGIWQWAQRAGGDNDDVPTGLAGFGDGRAVLTGRFFSTSTFGTASLISIASSDLFVATIEADGTW